MGVLFVVVAVLLMVVVMTFLRADQCNVCRGIHQIFAFQQISQKVFQTGPGNHNHLSSLGSTDLTDVQGIVVQAGDLLRDQTGDGDGGVCTDPAGKIIHRKGGGGNLGRRGSPGAAGQCAEKN